METDFLFFSCTEGVFDKFKKVNHTKLSKPALKAQPTSSEPSKSTSTKSQPVSPKHLTPAASNVSTSSLSIRTPSPLNFVRNQDHDLVSSEHEPYHVHLDSSFQQIIGSSPVSNVEGTTLKGFVNASAPFTSPSFETIDQSFGRPIASCDVMGR